MHIWPARQGKLPDHLTNPSLDHVFDCSALMALIQGEPGAEVIKPLASGAWISSVNLAEAHTKLVSKGVPEKISWAQIAAIGCRTVAFDEEQARIAGGLAAITKPYGLSVGDRACLALSIRLKAPAYTTDRAWKSLPLPIEVILIR
jgi:ribonuclease VapC